MNSICQVRGYTSARCGVTHALYMIPVLLKSLNLIMPQMILFAPLALFFLKVVSRQYQDGSEVWDDPNSVNIIQSKLSL